MTATERVLAGSGFVLVLPFAMATATRSHSLTFLGREHDTPVPDMPPQTVLASTGGLVTSRINTALIHHDFSGKLGGHFCGVAYFP